MSEEKAVWFGTPSQVVNLGSFLFLGVFFWLVFPLLIMLWKWLAVKNTKYELTTERIRTRHGILNKKTDEADLIGLGDQTSSESKIIVETEGDVSVESSAPDEKLDEKYFANPELHIIFCLFEVISKAKHPA